MAHPTNVAPTPQSRRRAPRQLPFQGSRGVGRGGYPCASVYRDADTYCHNADTFVPLMPVGGGVLDAPRSRDHRAALDAPVRRDQPHPRFPRCARLRLPPNVCDFAGTARAPLVRARRLVGAWNPRRPSSYGRDVEDAAPYGGCETYADACRVTGAPRCPSSNAGRAWKPAPTVGIRISPTLAPTPQSRRKAPRQLPFQGSRGVGGGLRRLRNCLPRS